jgi:multidrug resistance efflux pump
MNNLHQTPTTARSPAKANPNGQPSLRDRVQSLRLAAGGGSGRPRSAYLPWIITTIAVAAAVVFGLRAYLLAPAETASTEQAPGSGDNKTAAMAAPGVTDTTPPGTVVLDSKGYVIAAHQIQLSPQVGGEIIWLANERDGYPDFKEGAVYQRGDPLAKIDPVIYVARRDSAKAAVAVAEINLREVESGSALQEIQTAKAQVESMAAKLELAEIDERNKRRAGTATSRDEMEKAIVQITYDRTALLAQKATLRRLEVSLKERLLVARALLEKSQADLKEAEKNLRNCTILAPTTGIILSKKAELGGYVNPLAFGAAGYLCEMADLKDLEIELDIQERDIARVTKDQRCRIMPEAGQHDEKFLKTHPQGYEGTVSRRMPIANRSKGAVTVRVKVVIPKTETSGEYLLPDMGVLVSFLK